METLNDYLPFIIPLIILQLVLLVTALVMAIKQTKFRYFNKPIWILIIVLINLFGPILYFALEKRV